MLPSEAEGDKYEFTLNDNYQLYTTIFLTVILPTLLFIFYSAQIVEVISWFIFPILLLGGYLQYRVCKYVINKLTHYNRQKKHEKYWKAVKQNCKTHLELIESLKIHQKYPEDKKQIRLFQRVIVTEITQGNSPLLSVLATDEQNQQHNFKVPTFLGSYIEDLMPKGFSFVIERDNIEITSISATQLIAGKYNFYFSDQRDEKEDPSKSVFYNIYYRLYMEYLLSHKDAWAIVKKYGKINNNRVSILRKVF